MPQAVLIVGDRAGRFRPLELLRAPEFNASCSELEGPFACESSPDLIIIATPTSPERQIRAIRDCRSIHDVPILALWTVADEVEADLLLKAGADDLLDPSTPGPLLVRRAVHLARSHRLERSNRRDSAMAVTGRLLAGIVHELRGPLASILGHAEYLRLTGDSDSELMAEVDPILRAAEVMRLRLEHLMESVATCGSAPHAPLEASPLIRQALDFFSKTIRRGTRRWIVDLSIDESLPPVAADPGRLIQVVLHLLINAQEAVDTKGADGQIRLLARAERGQLSIEVTDNGPGIPDQLVPLLFEPAFTTKPNARGYGLYLASEFARELGGRLCASNRPDGGASFRLDLPCATAILTSTPAEHAG